MSDLHRPSILKKRSTVFFIILITLFAGLLPINVRPVRGASYTPGVHSGDTVTYGNVTATWTNNIPGTTPPPFIAEFLGVHSIQLTVGNVFTSNISATQIFSFSNGTSRSSALSGSVLTGSGNLEFWLLAGGLQMGDPIYNALNVPTLNSTDIMTFAGASRAVNHLTIYRNISDPSFSYSYSISATWDQLTGIVVDFHSSTYYSSVAGTYYGNSMASITTTNLWSSTTTGDFVLLSAPTNLTVNAGSSTISHIYAISINGFGGTISFSAQVYPSGPSVTISPSTVSLLQGENASAILTVSTIIDTISRIYTVNVTGTSGSTSHSIMLQVTVNPSTSPDFSISANPSFILTSPGTQGSTTITISAINRFTGFVSIGVAPSQGLTVSAYLSGVAGLGSGVMYVLAMTPGNYTVDVIATSGYLYHSVTVYVIVTGLAAPDFSIYASPSMLTVSPFTSASSLIIVTSLNGFSGTVHLSIVPQQPVPVGFSTSLSQTNVTLLSNGYGQANATLTVSTTANTTGTVDLLVYGSSASLSHAAGIRVIETLGLPPDFSISSPASFVSLDQGISAVFSVSIASIRGFNGTVYLTSDVFPHYLNRPVLSISPAYVTLYPDSISTTTLTISTFTTTLAGAYNFTITGTAASQGGFLSHTFVGQILITAPYQPDFNIYASPNFLFLQAGSSGTSQIQAYPFGPVNGNYTVSLTIQVPSVPGLTATLNPSYITITQSFTSPASLTVNTLTTTAPGNYTINITAQGAGYTHLVAVQVQVIAPPIIKLTPSSGPLGTKVLVQGSGFPVFYGQTEILMTFDDQLLGFIFTSTSSLNFTFNVPQAQVGTHLVKATQPGFLGTATAAFEVLPTPGPSNFTISLDTGTVYFPGDKTTISILTTQNGLLTSPSDLQITILMLKPDGSTISLAATKLATGLYSGTMTIPASNSLGTYTIVATAHSATLGNASALRSFEVKPTWVKANANSITTGTALVGLVATMGIAWKKGYLKRREDD